MVDFHPQSNSPTVRFPLMLYVLKDLATSGNVLRLGDTSGRIPGPGQLLFPGRGFHSKSKFLTASLVRTYLDGTIINSQFEKKTLFSNSLSNIVIIVLINIDLILFN